MRSSTWHALGNTYLLVEQADLDIDAARQLVGEADGIVEVRGATGDTLDVVVWNPDGSTAELSGNGTRIAAKWFFERSGRAGVQIRVHGGRSVEARRLPDGLIETDVGAVVVGPEEEADGIRFTPVSVGNPHAVVQGDPAEVRRIGPLLERHRRFPDRTNVEVVRVDEPGLVTARVWERGVGETSASGTGAVAAAAATHRIGDVRVRFPGGELAVRLEDRRAFLVGPAERVA